MFHNYFFAFRDTNRYTLVFLRPERRHGDVAKLSTVSILLMLVSRNVFHVVSALQSPGFATREHRATNDRSKTKLDCKLSDPHRPEKILNGMDFAYQRKVKTFLK